MKSAYALANGWTEDDVWKGVKLIWKAKVHQRVKTFIWILANDKLLANYERWKRRITYLPECGR